MFCRLRYESAVNASTSKEILGRSFSASLMMIIAFVAVRIFDSPLPSPPIIEPERSRRIETS
jgi:hypothetical protein